MEYEAQPPTTTGIGTSRMNSLDVDPGLERDLPVGADLLRRQRRGADDTLLLDLAYALGHELRLDGLPVDVLHLARGRLLGERRDALELGVGVLEARPDALEVEDGQAAQLAQQACCLRRDDPVHGGREQRELEPVGPEGPADVNVVRVACAPRRHDCDVVEPVGSTPLLATPDLYLHGNGTLGSAAD